MINTVVNQGAFHCKKVTHDHFLENAVNGSCELFSWANFDFIEGSRYTGEEEDGTITEDTITYYIVQNNFEYQKDEVIEVKDSPNIFHISERLMNEFLKTNFCYNQDMKAGIMIELLVKHEVLFFNDETFFDRQLKM